MSLILIEAAPWREVFPPPQGFHPLPSPYFAIPLFARTPEFMSNGAGGGVFIPPGFDALIFARTPNAVPETSTWIMLALGFAMMFGVIRDHVFRTAQKPGVAKDKHNTDYNIVPTQAQY